MNQITHWLDLSQVYGNGNKKARNLRMMEGGKLATSEDGMLPLKNNSKKCGTSPCFLTGKTFGLFILFIGSIVFIKMNSNQTKKNIRKQIHFFMDNGITDCILNFQATAEPVKLHTSAFCTPSF